MEFLSNYISLTFIDLLSRTKDEADFFSGNFKLYLVLIASKNAFSSVVLRNFIAISRACFRIYRVNTEIWGSYKKNLIRIK